MIGVMILFISIKKNTIIYGFLILLAVSLLLLCYAAREATRDIEATGTPTPLSDKIILVDPGHGGFDAGASANGLSEKDINLSVAKKLKSWIEENGGIAVMTRDEDVSTADESKSGGSAKVSDLKRRKAMVDESGADLFVSIHMNKFPEEKYWGAQVFYAASSDESKLLGETIQKAIKSTMNDGNERSAKKSDGGIFLLKDVKVPSVIVECGFLSNCTEAEKLKSEDYQSKIAFGICMGIGDYFAQAEKSDI